MCEIAQEKFKLSLLQAISKCVNCYWLSNNNVDECYCAFIYSVQKWTGSLCSWFLGWFKLLAKTIQINKGSSCSTATVTVQLLAPIEAKICSHHEARYLTNYEFHTKKLSNVFDKPNHNVTILSMGFHCPVSLSCHILALVSLEPAKMSHYGLAPHPQSIFLFLL